MNYYDILLAKKLNKGGGEITVEGLSVTENGTYSEVGKAYSPVVVNVELPDDALKIKSASGTIATFTDGQDLVMPKCEVEINAVQSGSGDPSPSNIRPISGFDGANVVNMSDVTNKQFFQGLLNGTYGYVDMGTLNWSKRQDGGSPYFRAEVSDSKIDFNTYNFINPKYPLSDFNSVYRGIVDKAMASYNGKLILVADSSYTDEATFKTAMSGAYLIYELETPTTPTITPTEFSNILAEFGINGHTATISWQTEAGTVYGGKVDLVSGVLTVDKASMTYNGDNDEGWEKIPSTSASDFGMMIDSHFAYMITDDNQIKSNYLKTILSNTIWGTKDNWVSYTTVNGIAKTVTGIQSITTVADWKTYLSNNPLQLVYELATPITYQLNPTAIKSLLGNNNVFADTNGDIDLEYFSKIE